jgi:transmembrane sensor
VTSPKLIPFPDPMRVREEAATWVTRLARGLDEAEAADLQEWLARPSHRQVLLEFAALYDEMGSLAELSELVPRPRRAAFGGQVNGRHWRRVAGVVAGCLALVVGVLLALPYSHKSAQRLPRPEATLAAAADAPIIAQPLPHETYRTAVGQRSTVNLQDGTDITLNTDTVLEVRYSAAARDVFLQRGEAYFAVSHDVARPFNVHVGTRTVQAVGTAFNIRMRAHDAVEVTVSEGKVKVWSQPPAPVPDAPDAGAPQKPAFETFVAAHEAVLVTGQAAAPKEVGDSELNARLAWQQGRLLFRGESLEAVLAEVARYTTEKFVIEDDSLRAIRVGGYFRAGDIDGLLFVLRQNFGIEARREADGRILLTRARPG